MRVATCHPDRKYYARDLCRACYNTDWRKAHPDAIREHKQREYEKNRARYLTQARVYYQANSEAIKKRSRDWSKANPARRRDTRLRRDYGLTSEEYREHLVGQAGRCLICLLVPDTDLVVDHDHRTGRFRGLLCHHCNRALGHLKDDPQRARRAAAFLERAA